MGGTITSHRERTVWTRRGGGRRAPVSLLGVIPARQSRLAMLLMAAAAVVATERLLAGPLGLSGPSRSVLDTVLVGCLVALVLLRALWYPVHRLGWCLLAIGIAVQLAHGGQVGTSLFSIDEPVGQGLWLAGALGIAAGALLLGYRRFAGHPRGRWADAALVAACVGAVGWEAICRCSASFASDTVLTGRLAPVVLGAVIFGLAGLVSTGGHRQLQVLLAGLAAIVAAETVRLVVVPDRPDLETAAALSWIAGCALVATAAWLDRGPEVDRQGRQTAASLVVPAVALVAATALLLVSGWGEFHPATRVLAAIAILVGVARLALSIRFESSATDTLREALTDDLTGLPNRRQFYLTLRHTLAAAQHSRSSVALLLIDLDRFKEINDSLGHLAGDDVLRQLRPRLTRVMRGEDRIARLGGDEFAIVLPPGSSGAEAEAVARRIIAALDAPFELEGFGVRVGASVGIAVYPAHGSTADELLQRADVAMYLAKAAETGVEVYRTDRDPHSRQRLELAGQLRTAIDEGQLVVHYQPKLSLHDGSVDGVEALVRWEHPTRGLLLPAAFLDLVRQAGLMRALTLSVLHQSLAQCAAMRAQGIDLHVDVNLCATNIADDRLLADIDEALAATGVPAHLLGIEVTEDLLLAEQDRAEVVLAALRARGVRIALDDFGSGYSSLAYLGRLPIDELKIDRYFVNRLLTSRQAQAIVSSTIELAHRLEMRFIAEGVEDTAQQEMLHTMGCDGIQGYLCSPPVPGPQLIAWLEEHDDTAAALGDPIASRRSVPTWPRPHHHLRRSVTAHR